MRFSQLIYKNLARRPARSALTLLALATAITAVVALFGVAKGFTRSFADVYASHSVDIVVSRQGTADRLSSAVDSAYVQKIAELPSVARAAGVMLDTLSLEEQGIYGIPTMGLEPNSWLLESFEFVGGKAEKSEQSDSSSAIVTTDSTAAESAAEQKTMMLGVHLADRLQAKLGDSINLFEEPYRVTGIFKSTSTWENGSMILPLAQLQKLTDRPGQVTYINVVLKSQSGKGSAQETISAIEQIDKRLLALTTSEYVETDTRMQLAQAMAWMTSAIALMIGTIGTWNTMLTSVMERTKEIGILRAIGWKRRRVVSMILGESCSLALLASVIGIVMAKLLTWVLSQAPAARGLLSPQIDVQVLIQGLVLAIVIGLLGAFLPAWRAAQLSPTEAFREN
ncbi:MAG: FtsX-like permease family protein [Pirellulales bacterium]